MFTSNAIASGMDPNSSLAALVNQNISNQLAIQVINDYMNAVQSNAVLTPQDIFRADVQSAVRGLNIPAHAWAGGPYGATYYDFPTGEIYDTIWKIAEWQANAARTARELFDDYPLEVADLLGADEALEEALDIIFPGSSLLDDLSDLLRDLLSDPLVLDLDGDGIELRPLAQSTTMFDIDGDGVAERTGWVSPDDGLLVQDANGNGIVDGVAELFGSANVDGFDELKSLDANNDGRVDANDPAFAQLLLWRDLNADGVSTSNELQTLAQAGIVRLNLSYSQIDQDISGNILARTGTYVRADGTSRSMGSVDFALNETVPTVPAHADMSHLAALPNLSGQLGLPDLKTAMFLDPTLKGMVEDLVYGDHDFDTFAEFRDGGFLAVVFRWAGIDPTVPLQPGDQPYHMQALSAFLGRPFDLLNGHQQGRLDAVWPPLIQQLGVSFLVQAAALPSIKPYLDLQAAIEALNPNDPGFETSLGSLLQTALSAGETAAPAYDYLNVFSLLDQNLSTGEVTGDFDAFVVEFMHDQPPFSTATGGSPNMLSGGVHPWTAWYFDQGSLLFTVAEAMGIGRDYVLTATGWRWLSGEITTHEGTSGNDLLDFTITYYTPEAAGNVVPEPQPTHDQLLFGYGGDDELRGNDGVDRLVGGTGNDLLKGGSGSDMYVYASGDGLERIVDDSGTDDTIYFSSELNSDDLQVSRVTGTNDLLLHFGNPAAGIVLTNQWSSSAAAVEQFHFVAEDGLDAGDIASRYLATLATTGADTITGSWASERLIGLDGDDILSGVAGNDTFDGGGGNDQLNGGSGLDVMRGGAGDDILIGNAGNDLLDGGAGNDTLRGGDHDDTYIFGQGYGQDVIYDPIATGNRGGTDTVALAAGISPGDITVVQSGNDLILKINGTTDQLTLDDTMDNDRDYERIERVVFADGTIWTHADLFTRAMLDNGGDNVFHGGPEADIMPGGAGNDVLYGHAGNDRLDGGTGNDVLRGGDHDDTYVFGRGYGQDVVYDPIATGNRGGVDTIEFAAGIAPSDITVVQSGYDLILKINGTSDQLTLDDTMDNDRDYERIERVVFADGTIWTHADLLGFVLANNGGNDTFHGGPESEVLAGGAGNDVLYGNAGNDRLDGGIGNDVLRGGDHDDTYVFGRGYGQDVVYDPIATGNRGGVDTVELGAGIAPSDITVVQSGYDLILKINGTTDQLTLDDTMDNDRDYERIEQVRFADGTVWTHADLLTQAMLNNSGNDTFYGGPENDTLLGGAGNDTLNAMNGNDTLIGGAGKDILKGGGGSDIFRFYDGDFGVGTLADTITDFARGTEKIDLSAIDPDAATAGDQAFSFLGTTAFSGVAGQLRYQVEGTSSRVQLDINGDGVAEAEIVLTGVTTLAATDFTL